MMSAEDIQCYCLHSAPVPLLLEVRKVAMATGFEEQALRCVPEEEH